MNIDKSMESIPIPTAGAFKKPIRKAKELKVLQLRELVHELNSYRIALETQSDELLRSQRQLSTSEKKYHALFDHAPVSHLILSGIGLVQEVNQSCAKMLGTLKSSLINKPFLRYISPEYTDIFHEHIRKVLKAKARQTCTLQLINSKKAPLYVQMESVYMKNPDGNQIQINTAMIDITDHKETDKSLTRYCDSLEDIIKQRSTKLQRARAQLETQITRQKMESKKSYRFISNLTSDCIFIMNVGTEGQLQIEWVTKQFHNITGYSFTKSRDPLIMEKIVDAHDIPKLSDFLKSVCEGAAQSIKLKIVTKQGEHKWISICAQSECYQGQAKSPRVIGIIKEISGSL